MECREYITACKIMYHYNTTIRAVQYGHTYMYVHTELCAANLPCIAVIWLWVIRILAL